MTSTDLVPASPPAVDTNLVEEAVVFINEKLNASAYKTYEEIGNYLLEKFFYGDIALASSRNPRKPASYRALCEHEGLIINPATLSIMVRVAAQEKFLLARRLKTESLSYTQKAELVKLPDGDEKVALAKRLLKKPISTRQTAQLVAQTRGKLPKTEGPSVPERLLVEIFLENMVKSPTTAWRQVDEFLDSGEFAEEWEGLDENRRNMILEEIRILTENSWYLCRVGSALKHRMRGSYRNDP